MDVDVLIVSYPRYCRYRAALRRLAASSPDREPRSETAGSEPVQDTLSPRLLAAVGLTVDLPPPPHAAGPGPASAAAGRGVRVLFCRATLAHPVLGKHAFRLDELGMPSGCS